MRLKEHEITVIKNAVKNSFGPDSKITLFGSRINDSKKGGDIDLLVETDENNREAFTKKIKAITEIQMKLGEQKIDMIVTDNILNNKRLIVQEAAATGLKL